MLTQIKSILQVSVSSAPPVNPPANPSVEALVWELSGGGTFVSQWLWNPANQAWTMGTNSASNWTKVEAFGWVGPHNEVLRHAPEHTVIDRVGSFIPTFSVALPSTLPIPFTINDNMTGNVLATGVFPANNRQADALACGLVDGGSLPIGQFSIGVGQTVHFSAVPTGGHAAMPADGESFHVEGTLIYS